MKAVRIHSYGEPEVLRYEEAPQPKVNKGEVLIRVHAAGVDLVDCQVRSGSCKGSLPDRLPLIPGWELSGVVEDVGPGVTRFKQGDEVFAMADPTRDGAYADYITIRETLVALKPKSLHHVYAAAVVLSALTASRPPLEAGRLPEPNGTRLGRMAKVIDSGTNKPIIDRVIPLTEARRAHELIERGETRGKIVLRVKDL